MSSVVDYFTSAVSDTYNETVDFWSRDDAFEQAADTIAWSVKNPDIVAEATSKGIEKSVNELDTAVKQDTNKLFLLAVIGIGAYMYFKSTKGGK